MGFLDNLFPNKKEKAPKLDKTRRPQSQVSRPPARPAAQPPDPNPQQQQPAPSSSIFGSLRRLKGSVTTSTPKKTEKGESRSRSRSVKKKENKTEAENATVNVTPTFDRNANVEGFSSVPDGTVVNASVFVRKRGKENVEEHKGGGDKKERPESRRVISSGREQDVIKKDRVKSSTISLNNLLRVQPKSIQNQQPKPKRPVTIAAPNNISVRRGHKDGQGHPDNISRTSSVTNLDSLEANLQGQQGKGAKPRKVASKERIDKQTQDGRKVTKNNNKLEPPPVQPLSYSSESLHEAEIQQLKKQLREMSDEKSSLALQLGEQRGQLNVLQKEIQKLKSFQEENNLEIDKLAEENTALRNRLRDVAHSPLSDNEKQQLLFESRHHSSAPASIATNVIDDNGGDATTCTTPDWDKHSSSNVSEVSVACLQDKINQMQETHYSTNEELQATLQELTDLQRQLTELQQENERLNEEKTLMFDSLCRQTERLNDSRQEVENLKQFLYRDRSDETGLNQLESVVEREQKLVELLRSAQEEREQLLLKLEQIQAELQDSRADNHDKGEILTQQTERVRTLECTLDAKHAEHKQLDQELAQAKDQCSGKQIEINRLTDLLENARTKINELEQDRTLSDKSELDELLDNARKEKDQLESEVAYLKEQLARSKNEIEKLKEQVFVLQEECKVTRNNAKTTQSDLEYKCEKLVTEKNSLGEQLQQFQEAVNELQVQAQCHLEDKRQLSAVLSETQRNLSEAERRNLNLETEIQELKKLRAEENDEWEKFQNDLLTSVRVANDFKTEAQQELQKIILENKTYREKLRLLEGQVEKLKGEKLSASTQTDIILTPHLISLAKNLDQSIPNRISLLEHPVSPLSSPTTPTSSMDKLFPILSKERRNRSRENLADDVHTSSEMSARKSQSKENLSSIDGSKKSNTKGKKLDKNKEKPVATDEPKKESRSFFRRNKSKDNLVEASQPVEGSSKENKGSLKKNKSIDDLQQLGEVKDTPKQEEPAKGIRSFLKRNKSKDNLVQFADVDVGTSKDGDLSKKEIVDKPRKSTDSSSSSSKSDFSKPEFFSKFIKKRDKKLLSHRKTMSVEEETLLKSLDNWYGNIDHNVPDEFLSKEDRAVKKLKILFEDDQLKERPVAHKPKEQLAISKPLLNSVVQNPKLEEIVRDPRVPTVEMQVRESALEDTFTLVNDEPGDHRTTADGPRLRIRSEDIFTNIGPKSLGIHKWHSLNDLNVFEEYRTESELAPALYRAVETDNLVTDEHLEIKHVPRFEIVSSDIYPNDSVSNPRYSTKYQDVVMTEYVPNDLPKPNIYVNYENLDEIINTLPKDVPESKLTEEQKFALKLKLALDDAEEKNTLKQKKKTKKSIRGLEISGPTSESVQKNWKLKEIMLNPGIKKAEEVKKDKFFLDLFDETDVKRHSTDVSRDIGELGEVERKPAVMSKSYEDISFSFVPENTLMNLYYGKKGPHDQRLKTSESSSSSHSFTSAEFNLDTGKIIQKWDIPNELSVKHEEDLLYNETINKEKNKKRNKLNQTSDNSDYKESVQQLKQDLNKANVSNLEEKSQDEHEQDLWLKGSLERYKKDLNQMVKRIDSDHLRESLKRRGLKSSNFETSYQIAQTEIVFDEYKVNFTSPPEEHSERQYESENIGERNNVEGLDNERKEIVGHQVENAHVKRLNFEGDVSPNSETVDGAISYDIITEFITNERKFSLDYTINENEHTIQKMDLQEPDIETKSINRRDINVTFTGPLDTKNQLTEPSENFREKFRREQSGHVDFVNKSSYEVSHGFDNRRDPMAEESNLESRPTSKPLPKERNKVNVNFYDIRFQTPVEVNANVETSNIAVLNEALTTPKGRESDEAEKSNSPDDLNFQESVEISSDEAVDEAIDASALYGIINDFLFYERMFSEGYENERKINIEHDISKKFIETNFTSPVDPEIQFRVLNSGDNQQYSINSTAEKIKDPFNSTAQSDKKDEFRTEQSGWLDFMNKRRQGGGLTAEVSASKSHPFLKPSPKERSKVTGSFKEVRFQNPVEVSTAEASVNTTIGEDDRAEELDVTSSPKDLHSHSSAEVGLHDTRDESITLYNTVTDFILNERIFSDGYHEYWTEPKEPVIFHCPTGLIEADALISDENSDDNVWSAADKNTYHSGVEAINVALKDMHKDENVLADYANDINKKSQATVEEVTYHFPSSSDEFKNSVRIEEILEDDLQESVPFSHSGPPKITSYEPNDDAFSSSNLDNTTTPQTAEIIGEYSYTETLKENQYGVVSPLDLRNTYRGVVKEYKIKYPPEPTEEMVKDNAGVDDLEYKEDFIDEFFKPPTGFDHGFSPEIEDINYQDANTKDIAQPPDVNSHSLVVTDPDVEVRRRTEAVSQIDQEMQAIMEKYLHTRTSVIVKESGVVIEHKQNNPDSKSNLKKYNNFENLNEIDSTNSKANNEETKLLEDINPVVVFENEDVKCVELDYLEKTDDEPLSLEDLKFIEEMKARYTSTDAVSPISEKSTEFPNITEEEIEHKYQNLTDEELYLIRSAKGDRYSRPLSDINERDLFLIDEISRRYFQDGSVPSSVRSSLQETTEVPQVAQERSTEIKENDTIINKESKVKEDTKKENNIPPLPSSLPPKPSTEYVGQSYVDLNIEEKNPLEVHDESQQEIKVVQKAIGVSDLNDIVRNFILNEKMFSESYNGHIQITSRKSVDNELQISFTDPVSTEVQVKNGKFAELDKEQPQVAVLSDRTAKEVIGEKANVGKSNDTNKINKPEHFTKEDDQFSHLPPSLRPRKSNAPQPVSYQPPSNVIFRDKSKLSSSQALSNRPSTDRSSANRLSDLMFKETIFVPVSKDELTSYIPKSPLSPSYKHVEMGGTWRNHEKPDFKQTIVVPSLPKDSFLGADPKDVRSPAPKSLALRETLFIPKANESKKSTESPTSGIQKSEKPTDFSYKKTIIVSSHQRPTFSTEKDNFSSDPPKSPQSETNITIMNKPVYHSYKETIIVPKPQESPDAKDRNLETLQKSVTQNKTSRSEVKVNFNRYSAIPKPVSSTTSIRTSERRPLSEPFKVRPLDGTPTTYEPVYSNINYSSNTYKTVFSSNIKKKPLAVPRDSGSTPQDSEYRAGTIIQHDHFASKNDNFVNMTDSNENFSERLANTEKSNTTNFAHLQAKFSEGTALKEDKEQIPVVPEHIVEKIVIPQENVPSDRLILVESKAETDILKNKNKLSVEPKESVGSSRTQNAPSDSLNTKGMAENVAKDEESVASGSSSTVKSAPSFPVTTKGEQLDITKVPVTDYVLDEEVEDVERKPSGTEISDVNLFTMDSHSSYDSYLELFKTKESKDFEDLRGKKSPHKNFLAMAGFAYVEELDSEDLTSDDVQDETRPKIVDFVPLDDDTTPFFTKENNQVMYDTLEREKTFHVLGQASKMSDKFSKESANVLPMEKSSDSDHVKDNLESSLEILAKKSSSFSKASSKSHTDTSGTSFTQAKKIFEALVEANKDEGRPKTAVTTRSPLRHSNVRDSRSLDQIKARVSKEVEVKRLGETGVLIKDGVQTPLDGGTHKK